MEFTGIKYSPQTGILYKNKVKGKSTIKPGPCGAPNGSGYLACKYNNKSYLVHRLIYEFMTMRPIPEGMQIDHINGNKIDNRWCNLAMVNNRENQHRREINKNKCFIGSTFDKRRNLYESKIRIDGKRVFLGYFKTAAEAHYAYMDYMDANNVSYLKEIDERIR